ncbi:MAG: 2-amino-4-oxopentanoate thiolase subunit OrtA [Paraclostridium sp.]
MKAKKGDFVRVHSVVLDAIDRAPSVPEDTRCVPLEMWVKGFVQEDADVGDLVSVVTMTSRVVEGILVEVEPCYSHGYGKFVPEILEIGIQAREILFGGDGIE